MTYASYKLDVVRPEFIPFPISEPYGADHATVLAGTLEDPDALNIKVVS